MGDPSSMSNSEKRRRRPPLACVACRRRKVRCDRKMPCQNCIKAHRAASCTYVPDDRLESREGTQGFHHDGPHALSSGRDGGASALPGGVSYLSPSRAPASRLSAHQNASLDAANGEAAALAGRVRQLEEQLKRVLNSRETDAARVNLARALDTSPFIGDEVWEVDGPRSNKPLHAERVAPSASKAKLAKCRYLGGSHWMHGITLVSYVLPVIDSIHAISLHSSPVVREFTTTLAFLFK